MPQGLSEEDYKRLYECIKSYCGLIFNPFAVLEWVEGKATEESASKISAVVDSAKLKYILEADYLIYTREILDQCCQQDQNLQVPDFRILQNLSDNSTFSSALGILATQVPDYLEENQRKRFQQKGQIPVKIPVVSVRLWVEETFKWKENNLETYRKRVVDFNSSFSEDIKGKEGYFANPRQYQKGWIKGFLKVDRILRAFNPHINDGGINDILDRVDSIKCEAVNLYWKVREERMEYGNPPKDTDVGDYIFLSGIPYADIVLMEDKLRGSILKVDSSFKSKVFSNAGDCLNALKKQGFFY